MLDYDKYQHNEMSERIVDVICKDMNTDERSFFRIHVAYYFCMVAASMRCGYFEPGSHTVSRPVNMFAINLGPSGIGKGYSTYVMEELVIKGFQEEFLASTWPVMTNHNIAKVADFRARKYVVDPDQMRLRVEKEFERMGTYEFSFTKPTEASVGQLREKLLLANIGSINMQIDEIGFNLMKAKDSLPSFLELYDGRMKKNLTKNTTESIRSEAMFGITPTNMCMFGVPSMLLDGGKVEEEFNKLNESGGARRCFFGYISDEQYNASLTLLTAEQELARAKDSDRDTTLGDIAEHFTELADPLKANIKLPIPDNTALLLFNYKIACKKRAMALTFENHIQRSEMEHRWDKARRLAGAYAFIEGASQMEVSHLQSAIKLAEDSGLAFERIMHRDTSSVKLAKYLGSAGREMTRVELREKLPYFKQGTKSVRDELLSEAIEWGYTNNISIRRHFSGGVEFFYGQNLVSNDLTELRISFGQEQTYNYTSQNVSWDQMTKLASVDHINWINHTLENGFDHTGHRHNDNCIPGFNLVVLDVDNSDGEYITIQQAKLLMDGYKAFYYTTKRHTPDHHRFRIVLPINYTLELDAEDFEGFMKNLFEWLPFKADEQTGQRSRKWLTSDGHYDFTDGKLLDALPFIPRTKRQAEYSDRLVDLGDLGGIERWFVLNTSNGQGNRNNNLLRYAMLLVDAGMDAVGVRDKVCSLNNQLPQPITLTRIDDTIMKTVTKAVQARVLP